MDPHEPSDYFCCDVCSSMQLLQPGCMAELECNCCVCSSCSQEHIQAKMKPQQTLLPTSQPAGRSGEMFAIGQEVRYRDRNKKLVMAVVVQVDRSIQPPGYGIRLQDAAADEIRFTEQSRLLPGQSCLQPGLPVIPCPECAKVVQRHVLARLYPQTLETLEDSLTNAWLQAQGVIRCPSPSCQVLIEKVPPSNGRVDCTCKPPGSSSCRCEHRQQHRYRCAACKQTFCDSCLATPYHEGLDCGEAAAPHCQLCDALVLEAVEMQTAGLSTKQLRVEATALGMDCSWCLERSELVEAFKRAKQTCQGCRPRLKQMCSQQLPCHHWCCGVRGSSSCLPCLQEGCEHQAASVGDGSCCFCWEPLVSAAVIPLACAAGHFVHLHCAKQRLQAGCPGPALTFDYLFCPLCGSGAEGRCGNIQVMTAQPHLQHELLDSALQHALQLRQEVIQLAKTRLKLSGAAKEDAELLRPGGKFDGRPVDYALSKFQFFACNKCHQPYYGGLKECGAAPQQQPGAPGAFDATELVCGSCSALATGSNCPEHGSKYVEWKCKYCCHIASWFCWGTTHMCSRCHDHPEQRYHTCLGQGRCVLTIPHPPPGSTFCLGCGVCRTKDRA